MDDSGLPPYSLPPYSLVLGALEGDAGPAPGWAPLTVAADPLS